MAAEALRRAVTDKAMEIDSRIFVAGQRGLVGSALVRTLRMKGYRNLLLATSREVDLRRQADVEAFFDRERPEYVLLAAAKVGGILANSTYKAEFIYDNIMIASNVIDASWKYGVRKLLNLGSSCIYPRLAQQPLKEEYLLSGPLEPTNEPYAVAKIAAIKLCRYYNEQYSTDFLSVMPTNLFGEGDNFNLETAHVLPSLIRKLHLAKLLMHKDMAGICADIRAFPLGFGIDGAVDTSDSSAVEAALGRLGVTGERIAFWGTGSPLREFLYADDLADACVFLMERYSSRDIGEFLNIGTGREITIRELASLAAEIVGYGGRIEFDSSKPDGTPRKLLDISRIEGLGWRPGITLTDGIRKAYDWYRAETERRNG